MGRDSKIQWTHHTFNPWRGCTKVSPGCTNCYAETLSHRNPAVLGVWGPRGTRVVASESMWREPLKWDREARQAGERRRVFCASLADVFEDRPELVEPRGRLWGLIGRTPDLDWLLLTKRPENWRRCWPLVPVSGHVSQNEGDGKEWQRCPNVWVGTSVEDQQRADERIPALLEIPAAVRFLSVEPLLGPIRLPMHHCNPCNPGDPSACLVAPEGCGCRLDWAIIGGESGHGARPCDLAWIRSIRDQCKAVGVACFVKQLGAVPITFDPRQDSRLGEHAPRCRSIPGAYGCCLIADAKGGDIDEWPADLRIREFPAIPTLEPTQ